MSGILGVLLTAGRRRLVSRNPITHSQEFGQTLVEYGLLLALIAIIVIVALLALGPTIANLFNGISNNLQNVPSTAP
jgi:pilus assembly protein Flp/PilA